MTDRAPPLPPEGEAGAPAGPSPPETSGLAIASLVLGIASLTLCLFPFAAVPGAVAGHLGLARIRASEGTLRGETTALAGLVLSYLALVATVALGGYYLYDTHLAGHDSPACRARLDALSLPPAGPLAPDLLALSDDPTDWACPDGAAYVYLPFAAAPPPNVPVVWCPEHRLGVNRAGAVGTPAELGFAGAFPAWIAEAKRAFAGPARRAPRRVR